MSKNEKHTYTINFIDSLKNSVEFELPKQTLTHINNIDKELNKFFKFLLEKKPYNNGKKKYGDKKHGYDPSWRTRQKRKKLFYKEGEDDNKEREINLILNKINIKNYLTMKKLIIEKYHSKESLEYMVESMFQKAVTQPGFCECYVKLYKDLIEIEDGTKDYLVSRIISDKCDSYLDIFEGKEETSENENLDLSGDDYDKLCEFLKQKEYIKGYSQFIGELHNNNIIGINKIDLFINTMLKNINTNKEDPNNQNSIEEYINSLHTIIKCIGENFNNIEDYKQKKTIFSNYCKDKDFTAKNKFKFMDICDLLK